MKQPINKLPYKRVKIIWVDICSSSQWYDDLKDVDDFTYSWCEDIGYLYSKDSKVLKIFTYSLMIIINYLLVILLLTLDLL